MLGNVVVRTGPGAEPLSLQEAKLHCRIDSDQTDEDTLITGLIAAARMHAESVTNRVLVTQGLRATFPCWPDRIDLRAPLRKVSAITYLDGAGDSQTLAAADYVVDPSELPGIIVPAYSATWPSTYEHPQAVTVDFISGYATPFTADAGSDVLTATGNPAENGDILRAYNTGGALPGGLAVNADYYAVGVSGNTLQLSATAGGAAIDITDVGTGTHFLGVVPEPIRQAMLLLIGHWHANREAVNIGNIVSSIPMAVDMLLAPYKVYGF